MKHYELVTVIDANLSAKDMKEVSTKIETLLGKDILDTDTIGLLPTAYPIQWQDQAYYVSYHVTLDEEKMTQLKSEMSIMKWLAKYVIYGMKSHESFLKMSDLKKRFEEMNPIEEVEEEKEEESQE